LEASGTEWPLTEEVGAAHIFRARRGTTNGGATGTAENSSTGEKVGARGRRSRGEKARWKEVSLGGVSSGCSATRRSAEGITVSPQETKKTYRVNRGDGRMLGSSSA